MTNPKSIAAILAAAALAAGSIAPAVAGAPDPEATKSEQQEAAKDAAKKPKLYCVLHTTTGSHLQKKLCKTREDWIAENDFDPVGKR